MAKLLIFALPGLVEEWEGYYMAPAVADVDCAATILLYSEGSTHRV